LVSVFIIISIAACIAGTTPGPGAAPDDASPTTENQSDDAARTVSSQPGETESVGPQPDDAASSIGSPRLFHATVEYGDPDLITDNRGPLWTYISFPVAGGPADEVITDWAWGVYRDARDEIEKLRGDDSEAEGEVNVQFDSYLVDDRYAGVLENGMFMSTHLAHPISVIRAFNIDTISGALLSNSDILDYSRLDTVYSVLREKIAGEHPGAADVIGEMDESWLEHIVVGHGGVIVMLERGAFLPSYLGAVRVTLPYDELGPALALGAEAAPEPQAETPAETLEEPPAETPVETLEEPPAETPAEPPVTDAGDIDPSQPMVALTFDDGPSKFTSQILDLISKYDVRVTFCVVGNLVNAREETVKRASDLGCEIIGHSWDHRDLTKLSAEEIRSELNDTNAVIESVTGASPRLYRPPYGAVNDTLKSVSAELGFSIIYWSVDPMDWETRNADKVHDAIMADTGNRAIVLSHDLYGTTADAMERVIPELISMGYQLVTVSELMYYSDKTLEAGVVYYSGK